MDELDEETDEDSELVLLLDEELDDDELDDWLVSVLDVETEWLELDSVLSVLKVLLDRLLRLELSDVADDRLLLESVLDERLDAVDWLDSDIVCELLEVLTL